MGKCNGCGKLVTMVALEDSANSYQFALFLAPVVSVWDCIVRKRSSESKAEGIDVKDLNMESNKVAHAKKAKKKQVKDELDRMKQAEKKKRRLEKALATSAAIRMELEKKKQMKKEEQQRLDEEGAAIAEAVALHVLIGEDSDDTCKILLKKDDELNPWQGTSGDIGLLVNSRSAISNEDLHRCAFESVRQIPDSDDGYGYKWNQFGYGGWSLPSRPLERTFPLPYLEEASWGTSEVSAGLLAAQAVSALQIGDAKVDTVFFNRF